MIWKGNHNQLISSKYWQPDDTSWLQDFRFRRQNKNCGLLEHKTSFRTLHRTNTRTDFRCLSPTFVQPKKESDTNFFVVMNQNIWDEKNKYSCKLTPAKPHKVRSKIKHTQLLCSMSRQPDDVDWVRQSRSQRQIKLADYDITWSTSQLFTGKTQERFFFCLLPLFEYRFCGSKIEIWNEKTQKIKMQNNCLRTCLV